VGEAAVEGCVEPLQEGEEEEGCSDDEVKEFYDERWGEEGGEDVEEKGEEKG
jgi:hypothetical protein